ncbi:MAG: hypothetical protein V1894_02240 [Chloroflexota bacterium]
MNEKHSTGTGMVITPNEKELCSVADYALTEKRGKDLQISPDEWSGELTTMSRLKAGEYVIQLGEGDGRSGRIVLSVGKRRTRGGLKIYAYTFEGDGPLM